MGLNYDYFDSLGSLEPELLPSLSSIVVHQLVNNYRLGDSDYFFDGLGSLEPNPLPL